MRYFRTLCFIAVLAAAAGCASLPELRVDQDPGADLSSYRTFAFFAHVATDGDGAYTTIVSEHLKKAARAELERLGYVYDDRSPQLRVNFFLNVQQRQEIQGAPGVVGLLRGVHTVEYKAGTLGVDIVDERRSSLVWQGVAEGKVPREARDDPGATIGKIVAEIFANFPRPAAI